MLLNYVAGNSDRHRQVLVPYVLPSPYPESTQRATVFVGFNVVRKVVAAPGTRRGSNYGTPASPG